MKLLPKFLRLQKLHFKLTDEPGGITLAEALAGAAGTVHLGEQGVGLWTPNSRSITTPEVVCDLRFLPLEKSVYDRFCAATKGVFLPAKMVVFHGCDQDKIKQALEYFDLVLTPHRRIKNSPRDVYTTRVLAYNKPTYGRGFQDLTKA